MNSCKFFQLYIVNGAAVQVQSSGDSQANQPNRLPFGGREIAPSFGSSSVSRSSQIGAALNPRPYDSLSASQFGPGSRYPSSSGLSYYSQQPPYNQPAPMFNPNPNPYGGAYGLNNIGYQPNYYYAQPHYIQYGYGQGGYAQPTYGAAQSAYGAAQSAGLSGFGNSMAPQSYQPHQRQHPQQYPPHFPSFTGLGQGLKTDEQKKAPQ